MSSSSSDAIPLVRASAFIPFVNFLEKIGAPVERHLANVFLPSDVLADPEALIPLNQGLLFLDRNARAEGLQDLGILAGREARVGQLGVFGRLVLSSLTLHDALGKISRIMNLYNSAQRIWLEDWNGRARLCHAYRSDVGAGRQYGGQFTMMLIIDCIRAVAGPRWLPDEVHIEHAGWPLIAGRRHAFEELPLRPQRAAAVVFDRKLLSIPLPAQAVRRAQDPELDYRLLVESAPALDFPDSLRQLVRGFLKDGRYQIEGMAAAAGISIRTMQRRLAQSGVDYTTLVDRARFDIAMSLIGHDRVKLIDIALETGYTDAASFTRAFKRWTGVTPSEFRALGQAA